MEKINSIDRDSSQAVDVRNLNKSLFKKQVWK